MNPKITLAEPTVALLATCLAAGALGGWLAARQALSEPALPDGQVWQQALAARHGKSTAARLIAQIHAQYLELYAQRPRMTHPALRMHLEKNILPGLALYQVLERQWGPEAALADVDAAFYAGAMQSPEHRAVTLLRRVPSPFKLFVAAARAQMDGAFPEEGWTTEWVQNDAEMVRFNMRDCFYLNMLTTLGAPELTSHFCQIDDVLYADLPKSIRFERSGTLARGAAYCDFCYRHVEN